MFFWMLLRHRLSHTAADNILTLDKAALVAILVAGLDIDFTRLLISVKNKRDFKTSTTYPFTCLILQLYRDAGVLIWHCDALCTLTGAVDIGLIRHEANVAHLRKSLDLSCSH